MRVNRLIIKRIILKIKKKAPLIMSEKSFEDSLTS